MASEPILPRPTVEQLRHVVHNFPLIDNHAHNLLLPSHIDAHPFESITSEAQGRALRDTFKSLPHLRAARQLRELYECADDADWEDVLEQRIEWLRSDPERLYQKCIDGTHAILMDDGLAGPETVYEYNWHDRCTKAPTKRIVRIETVAERLMEGIVGDATDSDLKHASYFTDTWLAFTDDFEREIQDAIQDVEVAGFKTAICYRSGLDIEPSYEEAAIDVGRPFERYVERCVRKRKFRIERKALNDYLVLRTLEILSEALTHPDALAKPLQFHTGLGDNDISLRQSNPSYLQALIENYPRVPFVLLHSAYPFTREAGYLATVYKHVYLDIGEVFPMVSRDGQKAILRQSLELVPGSKILYSSDGHWFPETYWLANKQFREVWLDLLLEYVDKNDLTAHQAINLTKDVLFNNSNTLYDLRYTVDFREIEPIIQQSLPWRPKSTEQESFEAPPFPPPPKSISGDANVPSFPPPPTQAHVYDIQLLETFMKANGHVKYVYVQWPDFLGTLRARILPIKEFTRIISSGERIGISQGNTGTLQNDTLTSVGNPVGQIYVEPDLRSLRCTHKNDPLPSATVLCYWRDSSGRPARECPRSNLEALLNDLQYNHGISLLCGFEIEVTFLRRNDQPTSPGNPSDEAFLPITSNQAWGTMTPDQYLVALPLLGDITEGLAEAGIEVQQFHSESGPGQYEFILPPLPPMQAIDVLIQARQIITNVSASRDLRATFHPQPFAETGTAAHAHISLLPTSSQRDMAFFVGGVLAHLPAICAFTLPEAESYGRVRDDSWTGGTWLAWGTQNRETPLRRVEPGRWEVRCLDGFANMYLAIAAILGGGILGLRSVPVGSDVVFDAKDVPVNPSKLTEEQRATYGVRSKLPARVEEAWTALETDEELKGMLAQGVADDFLNMRRAESQMLGRMEGAERRIWMIERY
ncbi:extracellular developmental signal biosynthesis protein FluG [Aaosphaeria arxii CBS 175.79]|uniref:Extracellular developmental signal biosynthesis protein FluG n=1 Tax=Aaosphaeria arxii CBS 175.79 TaxID=1450172 RepID=A0A6A5XYV2_9PLEO|nr:extracellular developmental signal biosynthesis protein FluG [Aaosphaeria arxii CBS 175.79]KAF2018495.1 extracellular developmental signal biosynthesis protein FluG [Aaosphaeria arxii CBS 175.79]